MLTTILPFWRIADLCSVEVDMVFIGTAAGIIDLTDAPLSTTAWVDIVQMISPHW